MWNQLLLIMIGFSAGIIIAGGEVGLLIGLSIIPRYAGITHTGKHILLYEDSILLGTVLGNLFFLWKWQIPGGLLFLILYGLFSGLFLGGWIMALAEVADIFPIFARPFSSNALPISSKSSPSTNKVLYAFHIRTPS